MATTNAIDFMLRDFPNAFCYEKDGLFYIYCDDDFFMHKAKRQSKHGKTQKIIILDV